MRSYKPNKKSTKDALTAGWVSIIVNTILFGLKFWAGIVSGSVALVADAWHTLSDSLSSVFLLLGVSFSQKPADKDHPFGHGRYELIATILIGCLLAWVSYNFFVESIERLQNRDTVVYGPIAIIATIVSIVFKEGLAQYSFFIAKKANSEVVRADGWHHRSDAFSSVVILIGIFISGYFWWIDGVMGIIVSGFILYTAIQIIKSSSHTILGEKPSAELEREIASITNEAAGVNVHPHHFHIHNYIKHKELTMHIYLPNSMSIEKSHELTNSIEEAIIQELDIVATIHVEPISIMPFDNDKNI